MAITLEANYSKKLGLPGYSSHQYSVTLRLELSDLKQVEAESARLYTLLQGCVDRDLQQTGYLPANGNGTPHHDTNGHTNGHSSNGNDNGHGRTHGQADVWACSDKQKALILKIVADHHLDKHQLETLSLARFGQGVRQLNKLEASGLIEELLETHGGNQAFAGTRAGDLLCPSATVGHAHGC